MSSTIFSYLGWSFLPDFVSTHLQNFWYNFTYRAGDPKPQPGSPLYVKHRRRIYIGVIVAYLVYTLYEADWNIRRAGDFYSALGVDHDVEEKELNSRFRGLMLQLHPDKLPPNLPASVRQAAEAQLLQLQVAKETLTDPAKRFAYDRLGPDIIEWKHAKTIMDYVVIGGRRLIPFYVGSVVAMLGAQWFGIFENTSSYWRYLTLSALFLFELHTITSPSSSNVLTYVPTLLNPLHTGLTTIPAPLTLLFNPIINLSTTVFGTPRQPYLPFQAVQLAHRATITVFIALSRLAPLFQPPAPRGLSKEEAEVAREVQRLEQIVAGGAVEAARLLALESAAFAEKVGQSGAVGAGGNVQHQQLIPHLKNFLVVNTIRQDPQVKAAVARVLARRTGGEQEVDVLGLDGGGAQSANDGVSKDEILSAKTAGTHSAPVATETKTAGIGNIATSTSELGSGLVDPEDSIPSTNETAASEDAASNSSINKTSATTAAVTTASPRKHAKNHKPSIPNTSLGEGMDTPSKKHDVFDDEDTTPPATEAETPPEPDAGELADTEGETPLDGPPVLPTGSLQHGHHKRHSHSHAHNHTHGMTTSGISQSVDMLSASEVREAREAEKARGYEGDVEGAGTGAEGDSEA